MGYDHQGLVSELELHIDNTRRLYEQTMYIYRNYAKKMDRNQYEKSLGIKGLTHLMMAGAKDYGREYGGDGLKMFSTSVRRDAAAEYEKAFHDWYRSDWKHSAEGRASAASASKAVKKKRAVSFAKAKAAAPTRTRRRAVRR